MTCSLLLLLRARERCCGRPRGLRVKTPPQQECGKLSNAQSGQRGLGHETPFEAVPPLCTT